MKKSKRLILIVSDMKIASIILLLFVCCATNWHDDSIDFKKFNSVSSLADSLVAGSYGYCPDYGYCDSLVLYQNHKMEKFIGDPGDFKLYTRGKWSMTGDSLIVTNTHKYFDEMTETKWNGTAEELTTKRIEKIEKLKPNWIDRYIVIKNEDSFVLNRGHVNLFNYNLILGTH